MARAAGNEKSAENEQLEYYKNKIIKEMDKAVDYMALRQLSFFVDEYLNNWQRQRGGKTA